MKQLLLTTILALLWFVPGTADDIVKKTSINKKTKNEEYANFLINCEKLHNETPYGFELKWGNK